ncbi:hypothetical protein IAR50_002752 [Cryptococcus sp. DSM 104548]
MVSASTATAPSLDAEKVNSTNFTPYTYYQPESAEETLRLRGGCLTYYLVQRYKRSKERKKRIAAELNGEKIEGQSQQQPVQP